jgi:hypothetical protein
MKLGKVEIDVPDCPVVPPTAFGIPSWVVGWGMAAAVVIILATIIMIAVVRHDANEERGSTQRQRLVTLQTLGAPKQCSTCGASYDPEAALAKAEKKKG